MINKLLLTIVMLLAASPTYAALDTKAKRGSVMLMGTPMRAWAGEPSGGLTEQNRLSLLKLAAVGSDIDFDLELRAKLNETSGTAIADYTGLNADGTFTNGPFTTVIAPTNFPSQTAINFTAADSEYISFADAAGLEITADGMTASFWIKSAATATYDAVITKTSAAFVDGWEVFANDSSSLSFFGFSGPGTAQHEWTTPDLQDDTWHHVVVSVSHRNSTTGTTYYIDGVVNASGEFGPNTHTPTANSTAVNIARRVGNSGNLLNGALFDVRFYSRALTADDVAELFAYSEAGSSFIAPIAGHKKRSAQ